MSTIERVHGGFVSPRRARVLSRLLASLVPRNAHLLDVGCGDGLIAHLIARVRPDIKVQGIDVLVRPETHILVERFDGETIPYPDAAFDTVMFVDVLHHTSDPVNLLREAARVTREAIVLKDHTRDGWFAGPTLRFMDWVGNARHGVALPYNYWPRSRWDRAFEDLGLTVLAEERKLLLYPWPASVWFGRNLHFAARLERTGPLPGTGRALPPNPRR